jgi:hypothetical protein
MTVPTDQKFTAGAVYPVALAMVPIKTADQRTAIDPAATRFFIRRLSYMTLRIVKRYADPTRFKGEFG